VVRAAGRRPGPRARRRHHARAQAGLSTALRVLAPTGAPVLLESPTYLGAIGAAAAAGLRVVPVPADRDGVRPDLLAEAFARTGARLFVCQPLFANPTGATLRGRPPRGRARRGAAANAFLVEDDYARDLALDASRRLRWSPTIPTATSSTCAR
jgi:DNA-binding transcriptional MocR family regulator